MYVCVCVCVCVCVYVCVCMYVCIKVLCKQQISQKTKDLQKTKSCFSRRASILHLNVSGYYFLRGLQLQNKTQSYQKLCTSIALNYCHAVSHTLYQKSKFHLPINNSFYSKNLHFLRFICSLFKNVTSRKLAPYPAKLQVPKFKQLY